MVGNGKIQIQKAICNKFIIENIENEDFSIFFCMRKITPYFLSISINPNTKLVNMP